jgi:drug/metabolite transporter (DMT)-like permease
MSWILLAAFGQFLNAVVAILDKYIVTDEKALPSPFAYAFFSCLITGGWVLIYVIGFVPNFAAVGVPTLANVQIPTIQVVGMAFLAAYTFFMALMSLYSGLKEVDASDLLPVIGAVSAIATFGMSYLFLDVTLSTTSILGIVLLASGTLLVSSLQLPKKISMMAVHSGLFFALHYITLKGLFQETSFDDGFFWSRIGFVFFALSLLLVPSYWERIVSAGKQTDTKSTTLVLVAKILAGVAAFLLLKATDMGDVAVVQALDGLKFVFIVLIGLLFGSLIPQSAGENDRSWKGAFRKVLYIVIISIGFGLLFL